MVKFSNFARYRIVFLIVLLHLYPIRLIYSNENSTITHGPTLGRIGSNQIGVWVRTSQPEAFQIHYGIHPEDLDKISPTGTTTLARDNTGWILIRGLQANTRYYYKVYLKSETETAQSRGIYTFRTMPDRATYSDPENNPAGLFNFSFEYACGNHQTQINDGIAYQPVYDTMIKNIATEIDFAILNGDWLYEERRGYSVKEWQTQADITTSELPKVVTDMPHIVGAWENYKLYYDRGCSMSQWHHQVPSFFMFDDHELLDDIRGAGSVGWRDHRAVYRDIGMRAWYDYLGWSNPVLHKQRALHGSGRVEADNNVLTDQNADFTKLDLNQADNLHIHWGGETAWRKLKRYDGINGDPNAGVYDIIRGIDKNRLRIQPPANTDGEVKYSIGRYNFFSMQIANCDFFFIDTRSHRQMPIQAQPETPGQSLLGSTQKQWLKKKAMSKSDADFLFVVSSVNVAVPHILDVGEIPGPDTWTGQHDSWTGFPQERKEMIEFWDSLPQPVLLLTGDLHNSFVCKISDNLWEFASGPHSSSNARMGSEGRRPANGLWEYQDVPFEIRWSTYRRSDTRQYRQPVYCVVQVNNIFPNPSMENPDRWVAFPSPQVVFRYYDGNTAELLYAESIMKR